MDSRFVLLACIIVCAGCKKNPDDLVTGNSPPASAKAVYVLNEGAFADPFGATLSVCDLVTDSVYQNVVEAANAGTHLGNLGDDMVLYNGTAYILMSGSENLVRLDIATNHILPPAKSYPGRSPHDLLLDPVHNKIFVTSLYRNSVLAMNLSTLALVDSIAVGSNPQGMMITGGRLFICNSGYGSNKTVTVIDAGSNSVLSTLQVSDGPTGVAAAPDGNLWVVCTGNAFGTPATTGSIYIINPASLAKVDSISFSENLWGNIRFDNAGYAYVGGVSASRYDGGPVHRIQSTTKSVTMNYISGTFYAMAYDEVDDVLYLSDAKQFATVGSVSAFKNGLPGKSFTVGYGPGVLQIKR